MTANARRPRRFRTLLALAATTASAALVLGGCVPGSTDLGGPGADREFYWGPIPAPLPMPAKAATSTDYDAYMRHVESMPQPPADMGDQAAMSEYMAALEAWQRELDEMGIDLDAMAEELANNPQAGMDGHHAYYEAVTGLVDTAYKGGSDGVAAWQTLYVTAGIPVVGADGKYVAVSSSAPVLGVSEAELRMWAIPPGGAGIAYPEFAAMIAEVYEVHYPTFEEVLYRDLTSSRDQGFATVFNSLGEFPLIGAEGPLARDEVVLSLHQVNLVLRRLAAEISARFDGGDGGSAAPGIPRSHGASRAAGGPCEVNDPWGSRVLGGANWGFSNFVFGTTLDILAEGVPDWAPKIKGLKNLLSGGAGAAAIATVVLKAIALRANMSLDDAPLVRTKTRDPGEYRDFNVTMSFDKELWEDARQCIAIFFGASGIDIGTESGAGEGLTLDLKSYDPWRMRIGDGTGVTVATQRQTDANGNATFVLHGAPYSEKIPETAEPDEFPVAVRLDSNWQKNDLFDDVIELVQGLTNSGPGMLLEGVLGTVSRMRILSFTKDVPFQDWVVDAWFEANLVGTVNGVRTSNWMWDVRGECGGGTVHSTSTLKAHGSFHTPESKLVRARLITYGYDAQAVLFLDPDVGLEAGWIDTSDGIREFTIPASFEVEQNHLDPGEAPLPPVKHGGMMGCGDGRPGQQPPVPDCGVRTYSTDLDVFIWRGGVFNIKGEPLDERPWSRCGGDMSPMAGLIPPGVDRCDNSSLDGGYRPTIADTYDKEKDRLSVSGTLTCSRHAEGTLMEYEISWIMTLDRVEAPRG